MPNQSKNKKKNTKKAELPGDDEDDLAAHMELSRQAGSSATSTTHTRTCGDANGCDLKGKMPHACSEEEEKKRHATVIDSCWLESRNVTENTAESLKDSHSELLSNKTHTHKHTSCFQCQLSHKQNHTHDTRCGRSRPRARAESCRDSRSSRTDRLGQREAEAEFLKLKLK